MKDKLITIPEEVQFDSGLLVIDIDYLAYRVACVMEERYVRVTDSKGELIGEFKNKTSYKATSLYNESHTIKDYQKPVFGYRSIMEYNSKSMIEKYKKATRCDGVLMAAGSLRSDGNYRDTIPSMTKYKAGRADVLRPLFLSEVRDYLIGLYPTVKPEDVGMFGEADDIISCYQFRSYFDEDNRIVVLTPDKDARAAPGNLYDPNAEKGYRIEGLGELVWEKGKFTGTGRKFLYAQLLYGDPIDSYAPCDVYKSLAGVTKKAPMITPKKLVDMLAECHTDQECWKLIVDTYKGWYEPYGGQTYEDWEGKPRIVEWSNQLQMVADFAHMQRYPNDRLNVLSVIESMGLLETFD